MSLNIFWDNSNIWLVGRKVCAQSEPGHEMAFRVHFKNLYQLIVAGRQVDYAFVGGSLPPNNDALWQYFASLNVKVDTQERGALSGGEVAVDQAIQLEMGHRMLDADQPGTIMLLTGDGNGYQDGRGFITELERAVRRGWAIEVVSWDAGCNRHLRQFAQDHGRYIPLEPLYDKITFISNHRYVTPV